MIISINQIFPLSPKDTVDQHGRVARLPQGYSQWSIEMATMIREENQTMHMTIVTVMRMVVHREEQTVLVMIIKMMSPLSQPPLLPALLQPTLLEIRLSKIKLTTLQLPLSLRSPTHLLSPCLRLFNVVRFYTRRLHPIPLANP
jgi:hypothetical protein